MLRSLFISAAIYISFHSPSASNHLEIHFIDVGQADATLLISPTGQTFLFDGGDNGAGNSVVVPYLSGLGISHLDYVGVSHYHADHLGGLDEIWDAGIQATVSLDRGLNNTPGTQSYSSYANRYSGVRQTVTPGQVVNLGGGVTLTCVVTEGELMGGGSVNISGSSQWENSASTGWLVDYGDFQMFMGGDLTGGGNSTTDVESSVAPLVGDVDVYQVNHHGSRTSSNSTFVNTLRPEFAIFPCGISNPYGYPKQEVTDRLNSATRAIPLWSLTEGVGLDGYVDAGGTVILETDGSTYTVTATDGTTFTSHVDEQVPTSPTDGDLVVAEFMRDPQAVSDTFGEWFELSGAREGAPVSLNQVQVRDAGSDSFIFASSIQLQAGEECLVARDGLPSRNGGIRPIVVWPVDEQFLGNGNDTLWVRHLNLDIDRVDYTSSWPGSSGTSAERMDLLDTGNIGNFTAGVSPYGNGDRGTPGETNDSDITTFGSGSYVEVVTSPTLGGIVEMNWHAPGEFNALYQGFVTLSTTPGFHINGTLIPGNMDQAYNLTHALPGWSGFVPVNEIIFVAANVPNKPSIQGLTVYGLFYTYKTVIGQGDVVQTVADPEPMVIQ